MAVEYCRVQKKIIFGGRPRQEVLKIEICTWNKKNKCFPNVYKISQCSGQDYKKIFIFSKMVSI